MKLRELINKNTESIICMVYEDGQEIVVRKYDNQNWLSTCEDIRFESKLDYENWKREQKWIKVIKHVSEFKNIK